MIVADDKLWTYSVFSRTGCFVLLGYSYFQQGHQWQLESKTEVQAKAVVSVSVVRLWLCTCSENKTSLQSFPPIIYQGMIHQEMTDCQWTHTLCWLIIEEWILILLHTYCRIKKKKKSPSLREQKTMFVLSRGRSSVCTGFQAKLQNFSLCSTTICEWSEVGQNLSVDKAPFSCLSLALYAKFSGGWCKYKNMDLNLCGWYVYKVMVKANQTSLNVQVNLLCSILITIYTSNHCYL